MAKALMPDQLTGKRLDTESTAELASMVVNRACIVEAMQAFKLYFTHLRTEVAGTEDDDTVRRALFRDGLLQIMACFSRNVSKRGTFLIPSETFAGVDGWEEFYSWLHDLRDAYAAHNFGTMRGVETVVFVHPESAEVIGVGEILAQFQPPSGDSEASFKTLCNASLRHVTERVEELRARLHHEAEALPKEVLKALPDARSVVPSRQDLRMGRKSYRAKTKDFHPSEEG